MKKLMSIILCLVMVLSALASIPLNVYAKDMEVADTGTTLFWPVYGHTSLSQGYGGGHNGIDISDGGINGATVRAAIGGTVTSIWLCSNNHYGTSDPMPSCCSGNGHGLVIHGDDGRYYNYAHMQAGSIPTDKVYYGARVEAGQTIGRVGSTGNSSGPHLHFQISTSSSWWLYGIVNPQNESYNYNQSGGKSGINVGDDFYALILNRPNWVTIGQADNANVQVIHESKSTYDRTLWHFTRVNDRNAYKVISLLNGKGLDVSGASGEARANVQCWPYDGNSAQLWYFQQNTGSYYLTADCTSMMMDMDNGDPSNGTNIHMYNQNSTSAQQFTIYTVSTSNKLNYSITAGSTKLEAGGKTTVTVGGTLDYVYNYKFHIIKPDGTEQVVDNKCNNVLNFAPDDEGEYKVFAEIKNPLYTEKGSATNKAVTINVGCAHSFSEKFVEAAADGQQGYILRTCSICGKVFKDSYMDYMDGWYTPANGSSNLPDLIKNDDKYTKQYHNYSEKIQTNSPGAGWVNKGVDHRDYVNDGGSYESQWELPTSNTRVLLYDYYYHFCIPGSGINSEANYEQSGNFSHFDSVSSSQVSVVWTGDDNGHTVYVLNWGDGSTVYCKSGTTCDGAWGTHGERSKAWYKMYVYQNKKEVIYYKWVKDSGWTDAPDTSADKTTVRFQVNADPIFLGDANGDGDVDSVDATIVQRAATRIQVLYSEEQLMCADIDGDGALTIVDATFIQRYDSRISVPYPVGEAK